MSKELIERLRSNFPTTQAQWEAADRIEELEFSWAGCSQQLKDACADLSEVERERDALQADNARLREALERSVLYVPDLATVPGIAAALAATPEQSLARIRNQVREECALEADRQSADEPYGHAKFRCANIALEIRAMKEPE